MLRVVFDTTVFCNDFNLANRESQHCLEAAASGAIALHVSEVVVAETKRRFREDVTAAAQELTPRARPLQGGRLGNILTADIRGDVQRAIDRYAEDLDTLLAQVGITIEPFPDVSHQDVVQRDLDRRRPFRALSKGGSTGYRDALIWESFIEIAVRHPDDPIVFVTNNSEDYCDSSKKSAPQKPKSQESEGDSRSSDEHPELYEFAKELREELEARAIRAAPLVDVVRNLRDLTNIYLPIPTEADSTALVGSLAQDPQTLLYQSPSVRGALLEALFQTAPMIRTHHFAREWNPKEGDYETPDVDLEIPDWFDDPVLDVIEGPAGMVVNHAEETQTPSEWIVNTTHLVQLVFNGFALKSDLYVHDDPDVDVLEFDWNDHVSRVSTTRVAAVVSDIRCTFAGNELAKAIPIQIESIAHVS